MAKRTTIPIDIGGMDTSGDPIKNAPNSALMVRNLFIADGPRLEKRPGWSRGHSTYDAGLCRYGTFSGEIWGFGNNKTLKINTSGTASTVTLTDATNQKYEADNVDSVEAFSKLWVTGDNQTNTSRSQGTTSNWDGTTFTAGVLEQQNLYGRTIDSFIRRLFIANVACNPTNQLNASGADMEFETADWTKTVMTATNSGGLRYLTIVNGGTDLCSNATYTTTAAGYVTWRQPIRARHATSRAILRLRIRVGAVVLAEEVIEISNKTEQPDWVTYYVTAKVATAQNVVLEFQAGTGALNSPLVEFDVADNTVAATTTGAMLTTGRIRFSLYAGASASIPLNTFTDRIMWSETDQPTYVRASNYFDLKDVAGPIKAIRANGDRLYAFKENAIWVFRGTADPDNPLQREGLFRDVGCVSVKAIKTFEGKFYFVGPSEVYEWDGEGAPKPLCGKAVRETMLGVGTSYASPNIGASRANTWLAVDERNRRLICSTTSRAMFVYHMDSNAWTYIDCTGGGGVAGSTIMSTVDGIHEIVSSDTTAALWSIPYCFDATESYMMKLDSTTTLDDAVALSKVIHATYVCHPIETKRERQEITIESVAIDHDITASQAASTLTARVYFADYSSSTTGTKYNTVTIAPLSTTSDVQFPRMEIPLWQTGTRLTVSLTHSGAGGAASFNMTGADAKLQIRGPEKQKSNPTASASDL